MAKGFKLKFNIPLFQMCRSKDPSAFPGNPVVPAIYRLSPVNPKKHDVGYPSSLLVPPPPPSSPEHRGSNKVSSRIMSLRQMCRDDHRDKQVNTRGRRSTSSVPSRRSNVAVDNEEESESLISCTTSFSDDSYSLKPERELVSSSSSSRRHMRRISSVKKVQRMRFNTARLELPETEQAKKTKTKTKKKVVSTASTTRMRQSSVEGKVRESFAVVKKSKDPYEDFKRSMVEMIREMEMRDAEDLQQLLQCFLALNSRCYHDVIVRAFMEIWQEMFVMKPASSTSTSTSTFTFTNTNGILQRDQVQPGE